MERRKATCVAEYEFYFIRGKVHARLFAPQKIKRGGYICRIESHGLTSTGEICSVGADSFQALVRSLGRLVAILAEHGIYPIDARGRDCSHNFQPILLTSEFLSSAMKRDVYQKMISHRFPRLIRNHRSNNANETPFSVTKSRISPPGKTRLAVKQIELASRWFRYNGKRAKVVLLTPLKSGTTFKCSARFIGLPRPKHFFCPSSETSFGAIFAAYHRIWMALTHLEADFEWELSAEGQTGLPICALTAHDFSSDWIRILERFCEVESLRGR